MENLLARGRMLALSLLALLSFGGCGAEAQDISTLVGRSWIAVVEEGGEWYRYHLSFYENGRMALVSDRGPFMMHESYEGPIEKQGKGYRFTFEVLERGEIVERIEGSFTAKRNGNLLRFVMQDVSKKGILGIFQGKGVDFHLDMEPIPVKLPSKPTVLDLYKAAHPLIFQSVMGGAYKSVALGQVGCEETPGVSTEEKSIDLAGGYIEYTGCGAPPPRTEVRAWKCTDGTILLVVNEVGISRMYETWMTVNRYVVRFDLSKKTMQNAYKALPVPTPMSILEIPRTGDEIKVTLLTEDGDAWRSDSTMVLKLKGTAFQ